MRSLQWNMTSLVFITWTATIVKKQSFLATQKKKIVPSPITSYDLSWKHRPKSLPPDWAAVGNQSSWRKMQLCAAQELNYGIGGLYRTVKSGTELAWVSELPFRFIICTGPSSATTNKTRVVEKNEISAMTVIDWHPEGGLINCTVIILSMPPCFGSEKLSTENSQYFPNKISKSGGFA